jgi:UDP-2,3-diacylglucosamine pyrophosphatase LpxH
MKTFSKYIINKLLECRRHINKNINNHLISDITHKGSEIIAIGDIHGDIELMIKTLLLGKVIIKINYKSENSIKLNNKGTIEYYEWIGGNKIVVQVGDQIDRCRPTDYNFSNCKNDNVNVTYDDEASDIEILLFFTNLHELAKKHNGAVYSLLGNHELMNIVGDIRYVSYENLKQLKFVDEDNDNDNDDKKNEIYLVGNISDITNENFNLFNKVDDNENDNKEINKEIKDVIDINNRINNENNTTNYIKSRKNIFRREGILAKFLACTRYSILIVNDYLFVHGGVLGSFIKNYNNKKDFQILNNNIKNFIMFKNNQKSQIEIQIQKFIFQTDSPFYTRKLGNIKTNQNFDDPTCYDVKKLINHYKLKGIIVGHTPQLEGINGTCIKNGKNTLFRVDVASSKAFKNIIQKQLLPAQVLKINIDDKIVF